MSEHKNPARVDQYDSGTYTRKGQTTRVVVREKPFIKSRSQRFFEFLRPSTRTGFNVVQGFELAKVMVCIVFPIFMLLYWKRMQKRLPDQWESQFAGLQHRILKEDVLQEQETDYFTIIETFKERREKALQKKQKEAREANQQFRQ
ncbi:hypothetical protein, conserved [Trypanosoma cruzi]|uniref:Uncharacterized protein n=1 Tax=Trypanosoma cruzi (strain CL Brener) TaxID=353153 RepID=Q4CVC9_TRYCC|nr:hypothetical protein, conserved [Trypanosoma cruzi]EAN84232.1 hypothetical protein, conserved [Trypanosoma cruzi]|eukprot:XP_806083.1 hypothetical protein [Trypanosoma cruzi strain CL Brener]